MIRAWLRNLSTSLRFNPVRGVPRPANMVRTTRPQLWALESRIVPTVTSSLVGSTATVVSDAAADAINITEAAGFLLLNGSFDWDTGTLGIQFLPAANTSTINLDTGTGADTVNLGDTGASPASLNLARVNYNAGGAGDQLHVLDNGNASATTYTYNTSTFVSTGIDLNVGGTAVTGGRFLVTGTAADTVLVQSTFGSEPCTIDSAAGNDSATIGTAGVGMASISGQVNIENNTISDFTVVTLEDSADTTADIVNITSSGGFVNIAGLSDAGGLVRYDPIDVQFVTINAGSGGNTFNVEPISETLNLNAGTGNNKLTLDAVGTAGTLDSNGPGAGTWTWSGFAAINYTQLDTLQTDGSVSVPLTVTATGGGDFLRLSRPGAGNNLRVSESGQTWILIPFAQVDNTITVNGGVGNDRLEVDQGTDMTINRVINYNGNGGTDSLLMNGNLTGASSGVYDPGAVDPNGFSGTVTLTDSVALQSIVNFTGLSPVEDLTVVANYTINGFAGADTINIVNGPLSSGADPITGFQENTIEVNFNGAAELVRFRNKTNVTVDAKAGADTVTLNENTTGTGLTNLIVDTNDGDDSVNVQVTDASYATTITSTVSSGGVVPTDTVNITNGGSVQGINGTVTVRNPPALTTLIIDDSADATSQTATIDAGSLTGLAPATINWFQSDLNSLTIGGGTGGNTFNVNNTPSSIFGTGVSTTLNSGTGADIVNVLATSGTNGANLQINGNSGSDTVTIGSAAPALGGDLTGINGPVTIRNTSSFSDVIIDDSGDVVARNATLDSTVIGAQTFGRLTGLGNPAAIQYAIGSSGDVSSVTLNAGSGGNTITINQTGATANFTTTVNTGTGADVVNVQQTSGSVTYVIQGQAGNDSVNVGSTAPVAGGDLLGINGIVQIQNTSSFTTVDIDDSGDATGRNATLDTTVVGAQTFGRLTGLGNTAAIQYAIANPGDVASVTIHGGSGGNTIGINQAGSAAVFTTTLDTGTGADEVDVQATSANVTYVVNGQAGADSVNVGSTAPAAGGTLANINGLVRITNPSSFTAVNIDDSGDATAQNATLDTTLVGAQTFGQLTGLGNSAPIQYAIANTGDVNGVTISGGSGGNTITVNQAGSTAIFTTTLNTGGGADVTNIQATSANVTYVIQGQSGNDAVNVGSTAPTLGGDLSGINGLVRIANSGSFSTVNIDDSGDAVARNVTVDTVAVGAQTFGQVTGFGNLAAIQYAIGNSLDVDSVTLNGGSGGNTYTIDQTGAAAGWTLTINMGAGSDTANVTPDQFTVYNIIGNTPAPPTLPGDTLNVVVAGSTSPSLTANTTATGLQGSYTFGNRATVNFDQIETLSPTDADLAITITDGAASAIPGNKVTYTIVAVNNGTLGVTGANITDTIPVGLTGVTFTAVGGGGATGFTAAGSGAINDLVNMPVGSSVTYTVTGTISPSATGNLVVGADITPPANIVDLVPGNNSATDTDTLTPQADLGVVKVDTPDPVFLGGNITYTITVSMAGPSDAQTLVLNDNIPANTTFVSFSAPAGWVTTTPAVGGTGAVQATRSTFAAGSGNQVFTLVVRVNTNTPNSTSINNTVTIGSATTDPTPGNNSANALTATKSQPLPLVTGADAGGGPHVIVYDSTGALQFSFYAYDSAFTGGVRVAAGDVTGDGIPDILTAAGPGGGPHVKVFDGVSGAEVRSFFAYASDFSGGVFIGAGDVNNDGFADIITGADFGGGPHVKVFDGKTGAVLYSFYAYDAAFTGGVRVSGGDVDGDNFADIITGAGPGGGPHVKVFSGATGGEIRSFFAFDAAFHGGVYVSALDVNGDSKADIVAGAGAGGQPVVVIFDGATLAALAAFNAYDAGFQGGVRVGIADVNGDGTLDLLTGAGPGGTPHVQAFNVATQTKIVSFNAYDPAFMGGVFVG
ncbi:MAG: beta strand repeat-containing protein [Gemmataceae bacterium]